MIILAMTAALERSDTVRLCSAASNSALAAKGLRRRFTLSLGLQISLFYHLMHVPSDEWFVTGPVLHGMLKTGLLVQPWRET